MLARWEVGLSEGTTIRLHAESAGVRDGCLTFTCADAINHPFRTLVLAPDRWTTMSGEAYDVSDPFDVALDGLCRALDESVLAIAAEIPADAGCDQPPARFEVMRRLGRLMRTWLGRLLRPGRVTPQPDRPVRQLA
ncbi:MAG: hypothetical protein HYX76_10740 [Acidobacteria bacterium]|nr:hypothetical protein [Acidobacteriota bacterium]